MGTANEYNDSKHYRDEGEMIYCRFLSAAKTGELLKHGANQGDLLIMYVVP